MDDSHLPFVLLSWRKVSKRVRLQHRRFTPQDPRAHFHEMVLDVLVKINLDNFRNDLALVARQIVLVIDALFDLPI